MFSEFKNSMLREFDMIDLVKMRFFSWCAGIANSQSTKGIAQGCDLRQPSDCQFLCDKPYWSSTPSLASEIIPAKMHFGNFIRSGTIDGEIPCNLTMPRTNSSATSFAEYGCVRVMKWHIWRAN